MNLVRAWLYVATGAVLGFPAMCAVLVLAALGMTLSPVLIGLPVLVALGFSGLAVGAVERRRLALLGVAVPPSPHPPRRQAGLLEWARTRGAEIATWRELGYTLLFVLGLWIVDYVAAAAPVAAVLLLVDGSLLWAAAAVPAFLLGMWLVTVVARLHARAARALLCAPAGDPEATMEAIRSTGHLVDAFDAERRRIERDLHDGAQQRLIALAVLLDLARARTGPDGELSELVGRAHTEATTTLAELRDLVQGIHPHLLSERGLRAAVDELVTRHPADVRVRLPGLRGLQPAAESTAFFMISEALTNVAKHGAGPAWVHGRLAGDRLVVEVGDSGAGGADPQRGSGLRGIADRVSAVGGRAMLSSPHGGPTVVRVEIPA